MIYNDVDSRDYLAGSNPRMVTPSYASINEMVYYVIEATESDFNNIMMNIGITELHHLEESGQEMVYEGAKDAIKGLADKFIGLFRKMWETVQGMIKNALNWLTEKIDGAKKSFQGKQLDKLKDKLDTIKADKKFGNTYTYSVLNKDYVASTVSKITMDADKKIVDLYTDACTKSKLGEGDIDNLTRDFDETIKDVKIKLSNSNRDVSSIVKEMKNTIRGEEVKDVSVSWVKSHWNEIKDEVMDGKSTKKALKKDYDKLRREFNGQIAYCKKLAGSKDFEAAVYTKAMKAFKDLRSVTMQAEQATISCYAERHNFYMKVVFKIFGSGKAKEEKKSVGESTTIDAIDSLFNW